METLLTEKATEPAASSGNSLAVFQATVDAKALARAVDIAMLTRPNRASSPILANALLTTETDAVRIAATDLERRIDTVIDAHSVGVSGASVLLMPHFLRRLLKGVGSEVRISSLPVDRGDTPGLAHVQVETEAATVSFTGLLCADDYPKRWPHESSPGTLTWKASDFVRAVRGVLYAASTDGARPIMTSVAYAKRDGSMELVGTDGHRLATEALPCQGGTVSKTLMFPAASLRDVANLVGTRAKGELRCRVYQNACAAFEDAGGCRYETRLLEGAYPNYDRVIPKGDPSVSFEVVRSWMLSKLRYLSVIANEASRRIILSLDNDIIRITANAGGIGCIEASLTTHGPSAFADTESPLRTFEIAFNANYLTQALAAMRGNRVRFDFTGRLNPAKLTSTCNPDGDPGGIVVLMPMAVV